MTALFSHGDRLVAVEYWATIDGLVGSIDFRVIRPDGTEHTETVWKYAQPLGPMTWHSFAMGKRS